MLMTLVIVAAVAAMLLLTGIRPRPRNVAVKRWHREIAALRSAADAAGGEHRWPEEDAIGGHVRTLASSSRTDFR